MSAVEYQKIIRSLHSGRIVAIPTDTVPGLAIDASLPVAIERLNSLKCRPRNKSYVYMTNHLNRLNDTSLIITHTARYLMNRYWPGPLTLIFPSLLSNTVAIRIPKNDFLLGLLSQYPHPLMVTSANISSQAECLSYEEIQNIFGHQVDNYVPLMLKYQHSLPSTIIELHLDQTFSLLRQGAFSIDIFS